MTTSLGVSNEQAPNSCPRSVTGCYIKTMEAIPDLETMRNCFQFPSFRHITGIKRKKLEHVLFRVQHLSIVVSEVQQLNVMSIFPLYMLKVLRQQHYEED